jgi:hypothetical protein
LGMVSPPLCLLATVFGVSWNKFASYVEICLGMLVTLATSGNWKTKYWWEGVKSFFWRWVITIIIWKKCHNSRIRNKIFIGNSKNNCRITYFRTLVYLLLHVNLPYVQGIKSALIRKFSTHY